MAKSCGSCTLCCKLMDIDELDKQPGAWCSACKPGVGCRIYDDRPEGCRVFSCQWLFEEDMPDNYRPDRTKVVLSCAEGPVLIANCDPANPLAWKNEPIYSLLKHRARTHWFGIVAVVARAGQRMWAIGANSDTDLGMVDPRSPLQFDPLPGGDVRVTVTPPLSEEEHAAQVLALKVRAAAGRTADQEGGISN